MSKIIIEIERYEDTIPLKPKDILELLKIGFPKQHFIVTEHTCKDRYQHIKNNFKIEVPPIENDFSRQQEE